MEIYEGQLKSHKFSIERGKRKHRKGTAEENTESYCNSILTFDIEVSSAWLDNGKVIGYHKGEDAEYWNEKTALALPYLWQFSCDGKVYYGREFRDCIKVFEDLPKNVNIIIWIHNLAYEFQFLCNVFTWKSVFARSAHKPIKCVPNEYSNIEFRCSYFLTRLSLENWGKQLGLPKMVGDLDYEILRTPLTPLSEKELNYGERDCLVVEEGIKYYLKKYKKQRDIPLTQTGTVRGEVKELLTADKNYVKFIKKLVPRDEAQYAMLQNIFAGGYTHANRLYAGQSQQGIIEHFDFASSYPTVMIAEKYPMSKWIYIPDKVLPDTNTFDDYAYIFHLRFRRLNSVTYNTYIQSVKCHGNGFEFDNGRVISAYEMDMYMTEQDYLTIKETYEWEEMEVLHVYRSKKEYLPAPLIKFILELYKNKTELKNVDGMKDIYLQSKQYINSLFGMCVTAILQADIEFDNGEWKTEHLTAEKVNDKLKKLTEFNPREKRYFLSYSWGCWITAYARRNLWRCIETIDETMLYCDTDSIFALGRNDFSWYNTEIIEKLKTACEIVGVDFEMTHPKDKKGIEHQLGIFDKEDDCSEFISLGAKRYVERRVSDGKLHLTVSGINKEAVELLNNNIDNFADGFEFDKDAECVRKRLSTYLNNMPVTQWPDGYISTYKYGINMRRNGYNLTMTDEYKRLIDYAKFTTDMISEQVEIHNRGRFTV